MFNQLQQLNQQTIFFHEDDYLQCQLLPKRNLASCVRQMKAIDKSFNYEQQRLIPLDISNDFSAQDLNQGFSQCLLRSNNSLYDINVSNLPLHEFNICMNVLSYPKFTQICSGYGQQQKTCTNIEAWQISQDSTLFCETTESKSLVKNIFFDFRFQPIKTEFKPQNQLMYTLNNLYQKHCHDSLILVDWNQLFIADLSQQSQLNSYWQVLQEN